jgi:hypothetical protein
MVGTVEQTVVGSTCCNAFTLALQLPIWASGISMRHRYGSTSCETPDRAMFCYGPACTCTILAKLHCLSPSPVVSGRRTQPFTSSLDSLQHMRHHTCVLASNFERLGLDDCILCLDGLGKAGSAARPSSPLRDSSPCMIAPPRTWWAAFV